MARHSSMLMVLIMETGVDFRASGEIRFGKTDAAFAVEQCLVASAGLPIHVVHIHALHWLRAFLFRRVRHYRFDVRRNIGVRKRLLLLLIMKEGNNVREFLPGKLNLRA